MTNGICPIANVPERRRSPRTPYRTTIRYACGKAKGTGMVRDVSSEGVFMETAFHFVAGDRIRISFQFRNARSAMTIEGEIARCADAGVGVRFLWS